MSNIPIKVYLTFYIKKRTFDWSEDGKSVTATRICLEDENHVETETVEVVSEITTPATCTTKGKTTYSATFTSDWAEKQTRVLENVDVLPHSYGTAWLSDDTNHWHECTECKTKTDVTMYGSLIKKQQKQKLAISIRNATYADIKKI